MVADVALAWGGGAQDPAQKTHSECPLSSPGQLDTATPCAWPGTWACARVRRAEAGTVVSSAVSRRWTEPLVARHRQHPPLPVRPPRSGQGPRLTQGRRPVREAPPCDSRGPAASSCPGPSQREARVPQEGGCAVREQGVNKPVLPLQPEVKASISHFMAYVHTTVNEMSKVYLATERRYNYTTPKTFLEQIKLYQNLLAKKRMELVAKIERLENGLMKLQSTASQVGRAGPRRRVPEPSSAPPPPHAPHARTHGRKEGEQRSCPAEAQGACAFAMPTPF